MDLQLARLLAAAIESYAAIGAIFALVFLPRAILGLDPRLRASPVSVRLLLFPGVAALWPLLAWRWSMRRPTPIERNTHRDASERLEHHP